MIKKLARITFFLTVLSTFSLPGWTAKETANKEITTTILTLADFVLRVGGDHVHAEALIPPAADPHTYEPKPNQLKLMQRATMYVAVGSGIEFELVWLDKLKALNSKMQFCNASEGIERLGEDHGDPHIWVSPANAIKMVKNIEQCLVRLDSANQSDYEANAKLFLKDLESLDEKIRQMMLEVSNKHFIVAHSAWAYFAKEYGLSEIVVEEEGKEPGANQLAQIIEIAKKNKIQTIFVSPQHNQKSAHVIASEIGAKVVAISDVSENYLENMNTVARLIKESLKNNG